VSGSGKGVELPAWRTRVSKAERPPTPTVDIDPSDEMANCIVLIQRLLRGRAVQNAIFEGKERRKELIRELRAADEVGLESEMADVVAEKKDAIKEASADTVAGETVSGMMDFLSKELVRKEEKDHLQALSRHATELRRSREVEESGRRQAGERLRDKEDEVYRQVVKTHYGSATSFVDGLVDNAVDKVATGVAMDELRADPELARALLEAAQATPRQSESLTRDLVASFLTPAAEEVAERQAKAEEEARFVDAAHKTVKGSVDDISKHRV